MDSKRNNFMTKLNLAFIFALVAVIAFAVGYSTGKAQPQEQESKPVYLNVGGEVYRIQTRPRTAEDN